MQTQPTQLHATATKPITLYYCKAGLATGKTIRISHGKEVHHTGCVTLWGCDASMNHGNSTGPAKKSGARCTLIITKGSVIFTA